MQWRRSLRLRQGQCTTWDKLVSPSSLPTSTSSATLAGGGAKRHLEKVATICSGHHNYGLSGLNLYTMVHFEEVALYLGWPHDSSTVYIIY